MAKTSEAGSPGGYENPTNGDASSGGAPEARSAVSASGSTVARLREGTEVLRTGGGATLNASECNDVLDVIETARYLTKEPFGSLNERSFYRLREALDALS